MGLGPPVCTKCRKILSYDQDYEAKKINPWHCETCGSISDIDTGNLWQYSDEQIVEIEMISYGKSNHMEWVKKLRDKS